MSIWIERILMGCSLYETFALSLFIPAGLFLMFLSGQNNIVRFTLHQMFCFYMCCLFALVFLPLPTMEQAADLGRDIQVIPFYFIYDILSTRSAGAVFCAVFNVVMTIPFGMFLRYVLGLDQKTTLTLGLALTLFIEIGQLTGLFFLFNGSYRLCDIDDIITNVLGTWIGFRMVLMIENYIPTLSSFVMDRPKFPIPTGPVFRFDHS